MRDYRIKKWQKCILRYIAKKIVIQSGDHRSNIIKYFKIINEASRKEFREDNLPTQIAFLTECFEESLEGLEY